MKPQESLGDWQDTTISNWFGGVVLDKDSETLEESDALKLDNIVFRKGVAKNDTGSLLVTDTDVLNRIIGNPRKVFKHVLRDQTIQHILITDKTVYRLFSDQWRIVSGNVATTTTGSASAGAASVTVTSAAGFTTGDAVSIELNNGKFQAFIVTVSGTTLNLDGTLFDAVSAGKAVVRGPRLLGIPGKHVTGVGIPWNDFLVFTNAVDFIQRYDPAVNTVVQLPSLPSNTVAETLALYDNSLIIAGLDEAGTKFPTRYRYSAKGDLTNWTTLEAGSVDLLEKQARAVQLLKLGPYLILYRSSAITRISIANTSNKRFSTETMITDKGIFSNVGAVDLTDKHMVWGFDALYWYRGGYDLEEIPCNVKQMLFGPEAEISDSNRPSCHLVSLNPVREVFGFYQLSGDTGPRKAFRYTLDHGNWVFRNFSQNIWGSGVRTGGSEIDWNELVGDWVAQVGDWNSYSTFGSVESTLLCFEKASNQNGVTAYNFLTPQDFTDSAGAGVAVSTEFQTKDFSHPILLIRHDRLELGLAGGTIQVDYSMDKGVSWQPLGTIVADAIPKRYRLFKQFTVRALRFRLTSSTGFLISWFNMRYKYDFEW